MKHTHSKHPDDLVMWPDGTWCWRSELQEMGYMGDDFRVVHIDTLEWLDFISSNMAVDEEQSNGE